MMRINQGIEAGSNENTSLVPLTRERSGLTSFSLFSNKFAPRKSVSWCIAIGVILATILDSAYESTEAFGDFQIHDKWDQSSWLALEIISTYAPLLIAFAPFFPHPKQHFRGLFFVDTNREENKSRELKLKMRQLTDLLKRDEEQLPEELQQNLTNLKRIGKTLREDDFNSELNENAHHLAGLLFLLIRAVYETIFFILILMGNEKIEKPVEALDVVEDIAAAILGYVIAFGYKCYYKNKKSSENTANAFRT